jgi:serine/threonine protein phosphatase PrpC
MAAERLEARSGFASETGLRPRNEDFGAISGDDARRGVVAAVADGIGGGPGGREAAEIAVETFIRSYRAASEALSMIEAGKQALAEANAAIRRAAEANPRLRGMGTTLSALAIEGAQALTVHIGDSRIYRLRRGGLLRLTRDHNLGDRGLPHILTRSLGTREEAPADCESGDASPGDRYLLCTDGVTTALSDPEIADILMTARDPAEAARRTAAAALASGSADNATALVLDVTEGGGA